MVLASYMGGIKMRNRVMPALAACVVALAVISAPAAQSRSGAREAVNRRFDAAAPAVGEPMPEVTLHSADGDAVRLGDLLQGHYTVLVLGCLT